MDLGTDFRSAFRLAHSSGEILERNPSLSGVSKLLPQLPDLHVEGYGVVGLPLNRNSVSLLRKSFTKAPFGKGTKTIVDESVRKCWQLGKDKFCFKNPLWKSALQTLAVNAALMLGVVQSVEAIPYKLLLYEEGSFFLPHQDTEKEPGMFATLIVQLPSLFTGGELVITLPGGEQHECDMGSPANPPERHVYFAMHYADVKHEIKPLKSGVRLAVAYSVCFRGSSGIIPSVQSVLAEKDPFRKAALLYQQEELIWPLIHQYTHQAVENQGLAGLKGQDYMLAARMNKYRNLHPEGKRYDVLLMIGKKCEYYVGADHCEIDELQETVDYSLMYDLEGTPLPGCMVDFEREYDDWGSGEDTDEVEYTGNEGSSLTTVYHRSFLVLMPEASNGFESRFRLEGFHKLWQDVIQRYHSRLTGRNEQLLIEEAQNIIQQGWAVFNSWRELDKVISFALQISSGPLLRTPFCMKPQKDPYLWISCLSEHRNEESFIRLLDPGHFPEAHEALKSFMISATSMRNGSDSEEFDEWSVATVRQLSKLASFVELILPEACRYPLEVKTYRAEDPGTGVSSDSEVIAGYRELIGTYCEHLVTCFEGTDVELSGSMFRLDSIQRGINFCIFADFDVERYLRAVLKWTYYLDIRPLLDIALSQPTLGEQLVMAILRAMATTPFLWCHNSRESKIFAMLDLCRYYEASEDVWNVLKTTMKEAKTLSQLKYLTKSERDTFKKESTREVRSWCMGRANAKCKTMEAFLKSSERTIIVKNQFRGIAEARLFRIEGDGFSVDYKATGIGKSAQVLVTKSRLIFDSNNQDLQDSKMVLDFLESLDC